MSDKLEHTFKKTLENFEVPYSAEAWTSMNARLDATAGNSVPNGGSGFMSPLKWIAAGLIVAGGITTAVLLTDKPENKSDAKQTASELPQDVKVPASTGNTQQKRTQNTAASASNDTDLNAENVAPETGLPNAERTSTSSGSAHITSDNSSSTPSGNRRPTNDPGNGSSSDSGTTSHTVTTTGGKNSGNSGTPNHTNETVISVPQLPTVCLGQSWTIQNPNKSALVLLAPNGKTYTIPAAARKTIEPETAGEYLLGYFKGSNFMAETSANVDESKQIDFLVDDADPYDNGVPTIYFSAGSTAGQLSWHFENRSLKQAGANAEVHYFKKGTYTATLESRDENGCLAKTDRKITVTEDFNLLAPEGFDPNNPDPRNNTFMPVSLQLRDAQFTLTIFDPKNGEILFQTSDANQGWDGTDRRTGKTVGMNEVFYWKVVLKNPMEGENQVYSGNLTVRQR